MGSDRDDQAVRGADVVERLNVVPHTSRHVSSI